MVPQTKEANVEPVEQDSSHCRVCPFRASTSMLAWGGEGGGKTKEGLVLEGGPPGKHILTVEIPTCSKGIELAAQDLRNLVWRP